MQQLCWSGLVKLGHVSTELYNVRTHFALTPCLALLCITSSSVLYYSSRGCPRCPGSLGFSTSYLETNNSSGSEGPVEGNTNIMSTLIPYHARPICVQTALSASLSLPSVLVHMQKTSGVSYQTLKTAELPAPSPA